MEKFLPYLSDVADSPLALIGYLTVILVWGYIILSRSRLGTIQKILKDVPRDQRALILSQEYGVVPAEGVTADQWLASRRQTFVTMLIIACLASVLIVCFIGYMAYKENIKANIASSESRELTNKKSNRSEIFASGSEQDNHVYGAQESIKKLNYLLMTQSTYWFPALGNYIDALEDEQATKEEWDYVLWTAKEIEARVREAIKAAIEPDPSFGSDPELSTLHSLLADRAKILSGLPESPPNIQKAKEIQRNYEILFYNLHREIYLLENKLNSTNIRPEEFKDRREKPEGI